MANSLFLISGLIPFLTGIGFILIPRHMRRFDRAYARKTGEWRKKLFKRNRLTGYFFLANGFVILLSFFYPKWIFNCFLIARIVAGVFFPEWFVVEPVSAPRPVTPTVWI